MTTRDSQSAVDYVYNTWYTHADSLSQKNKNSLDNLPLSTKNQLLHFALCDYREHCTNTFAPDEKSFLNLIECFLEQSTDPNYIPKTCESCERLSFQSPRHLLHIAGSKKLPEIMKLLTRYQANWRFRDSQGNNLLHLLCSTHDYTILQEVFMCALTQNIDITTWVNQKNAAGNTPFHVYLRIPLFYQKDAKECVNLFLQQGAKLHLRTTDKKTPLALLMDQSQDAYNGDHMQSLISISKMLIKKGANIYTVDSSNTAPLQILSDGAFSIGYGHELSEYIQSFYVNYLASLRVEEGFPETWNDAPIQLFAACLGTPLEIYIRQPFLKTLYQDSTLSKYSLCFIKKRINHFFSRALTFFVTAKGIDEFSQSLYLEKLPQELQDKIYQYVIIMYLKDYGILSEDLEQNVQWAFSQLMIFYQNNKQRHVDELKQLESHQKMSKAAHSHGY